MTNPNLPPAEYDMDDTLEYRWALPSDVVSDGIEFIPLSEQDGLENVDADELRFGYGSSLEGGSEN